MSVRLVRRSAIYTSGFCNSHLPVSQHLTGTFSRSRCAANSTHSCRSLASIANASRISDSPRQTPLLPEFSLQDKVIVVSGGAQGLGLVQAEALLEAGAKVHALDRQIRPSPDFHIIAERAKELGSSLEYHQVDVRNIPQLSKTIADIAGAESGINGLIAAAGVQQEMSALDYTPEDAARMFEINVTGVMMTAREVARQMIERKSGGSIVLIASMSGTVANRGMNTWAYNSSKAAVLGMTRNLAMEWGPHNIRVNSISPGYILTSMLKNLFIKYPEREAEWAKLNMLGRLSTPEEYRGAAVFLLSDASSFMTGADMIIDGGHTAW